MPLGVHTLVDAAAGSDKTTLIINMMAQASPIIEDMLVTPANNRLIHKIKMRTGLPEAVWRRLYQGVPPSKATYATVQESCGLLESVARLDRAELDGVTDKANYRLQEAAAHLEAIAQKLDTHFFYGSEKSDPESFTGLSPRYGSLSADTAKNIINAGGTGTTNTSIWLVTWGNRTLHMFYPEGSKAGIEHTPKDNVEVTDASGHSYEAMIDRFILRLGLALLDWRYNARICNIDVSTFGTTSAPVLSSLMNKAIWKMPTTLRRQTPIEMLDDKETQGFLGGKPVFYMNRDAAEELERQVDEKSGLNISRQEAAEGGFPVMTYKGIPIHVTDGLLSTESAVV